MAAILQLRRGTSTPTLLESELFFNSLNNTLIVGQSNDNHTLVKLGANTGSIFFSGDITGSSLLLSGNAVIVGNITLGGSIYLGDGGATDEIIINASLSGSLVPDTDSVYDLGSTNFRYKNLHVLSASIENLTVGGSGILSSSQQITDYNTFLEIGGMDVVSGSSQIDLTQTTNYVSGIKTRLNSETVISGSSQVQIDSVTGFTAFSSSVDDRLDSLESDGDVVDGRLTNLELFSSSQELKDSTLETVTSSFDSRLGNIELFTSSYFTDSASVDSRLDYVEGEFSQSVDSRIDLLESFSSSLDDAFVTTNELHTATSSLSASLTDTDNDFENRINILETTFSSSVDFRLDAQEAFSESLDNTYEEKASGTHTLFSGSSQVNADTITNFDTNVKDKLNSDGIISGSSQVTISSTTGYTSFSASIATTDEGQNDRLDSIEAYTASVDNLYEEIASGTHTLVSGSSQIQINDVTGFTSYSSSVDSRLDSLEDDSHTHSNKTQLDTINQNLSKTSNVTFNNITASGDVVISGDLTVLGNATEIQTSELRIEDKLITVASGSTNSAEADGAGIEIDGAGKSIIWDDATQSFILNAQVSSSVGFKGDGSELTGVTAADVEYLDVLNKPTLVSGSTQISFIGIADKPTLVSGSDQVTASLDSRYLEINGDGVFSGSSQVNADTIVNFDSNVKDKMNLDNVISGSTQITNGSGILSSSNETFTQFSSSIDSRVDTLETTFSSSVDSRLDEIETTFSSSVDSRLDAQELFSESLDTKYLNTNGDNVVSGSTGEQLTASLDLRYEEISSGTHTLVSGSSQIDVSETQKYSTLATTGSNIFIGNQTITGSLYVSGSNIEIESPITSSNTIEATFFYGDGSNLTNIVASELSYENITNLPSGLVSQSSQIDVTQTQNYGSIRQYDDTDNTTHLNSLGVVSGSTYSSPSQGTLRATINGSNSDVNLGLQSTDTPIFNGIKLNSITQVPSGSEFTVLLQSSSNEIISSELGNAAFYHVSASISDGNPEVLGNAGAVKSYVDGKIIAASAGDITEVNAGPGLGGGSTIGAATLNLDTGSQHFIDGVTGIAPTLPDGLVSGSSQISYPLISNIPAGIISGSDQVTQSLDTRYVNVSGDTVTGDLIITGDLTVNGTTTTISTTNLNVEDNIIELNYGGSATTGGILVKDVTGGSTTSGSLLWDGTNDVWKAGILGSESELLTIANFTSTLPSGLVSGSSQIDVTQTTNYSSINQYSDTKVQLKLDADNVHSGSYLGTATTSQLDEGSNLYYTDLRVKTKLDSESVISGSSQVLGGTGILSSSNENFTDFSSSVDSRFGALSTDYNDLQNVPSGIVSSSEQISNYTKFLEINGDGVISGSSQVQIDSVTGFISFSSSVDTRIDLLESFSSSLDAGFVTEAELNTATQSLQDSIDLKLDISTYTPFSTSVDSRLGGLEGITSENPLTFTDTTTIDLVRTGDTITANAIGGVVSGSSQIDLTSTTNYVSGIKTRLDVEGVISSSAQLLGGSGLLSSSNETFVQFSSSIDNKVSLQESFSSSIDTTIKTKLDTENVISGSSQISLSGFSTTDLSEGTNLYYTDTRVKTKLNAEAVVSGSSHILTLVSIDEDTMTSNSDTKLPTQQSVKAYVDNKVSALVDSAPGALDTLNELAAALGDDANFSTTLSNQIAGKVSQSLQIISGNGLTGGGNLTTDRTINVVGTADRISVSADAVDIASTYVGQSTITTLGTIATGTWNGSVIASAYLDADTAHLSGTQTFTGAKTFSDTTASTTKTTGAVIVSGGVGIAKTLNVGEDVVAYASSDRRLKENITPIQNALQKINSIGGYSFDWNVEKQHIYSGKDYGVIAQEIEEILPELVDTRENGYKAVKYDKLVSLLIEGIKELSQEVSELKQQINK